MPLSECIQIKQSILWNFHYNIICQARDKVYLIFSKINQHNNLSLLLTDSRHGMNFIFANITESSRYFNFTLFAGATRSFDLIIIDDNFAESYYRDDVYFGIGVYNSSDRYYYCDSGYIRIENNDGMCV